MQRVAIRAGGLWLAAILLTAASYTGIAIFEAPHPGADLQPMAGADGVIELVQGQQSILWTTLEGTVSLYKVLGWATSHDDVELGGALMIRKPSDGTAGVIDFGEKPQSVLFELAP